MVFSLAINGGYNCVAAGAFKDHKGTGTLILRIYDVVSGFVFGFWFFTAVYQYFRYKDEEPVIVPYLEYLPPP